MDKAILIICRLGLMFFSDPEDVRFFTKILPHIFAIKICERHKLKIPLPLFFRTALKTTI
jgi:hypothetical protein